jgi:DNA-binding NarL/FixJ family response regulator
LQPDIIVCDDHLPFRDGIDVLAALRAAGLGMPLVLIGTNVHSAAQLLKRGAAAFVHKFDIHDELRAAVLLAVYGEQFISRSSVQSLD